jgi:hypothetical protein
MFLDLEGCVWIESEEGKDKDGLEGLLRRRTITARKPACFVFVNEPERQESKDNQFNQAKLIDAENQGNMEWLD